MFDNHDDDDGVYEYPEDTADVSHKADDANENLFFPCKRCGEYSLTTFCEDCRQDFEDDKRFEETQAEEDRAWKKQQKEMTEEFRRQDLAEVLSFRIFSSWWWKTLYTYLLNRY